MRHGIQSFVFIAALTVPMAGAVAASIPPDLPANPTATLGTRVNAEGPGTVRVTDDTIVCHYERPTGTLLTSMTCRSRRAWALMQSDAQEFMDFGERGSHQTDDNAHSGS